MSISVDMFKGELFCRKQHAKGSNKMNEYTEVQIMRMMVTQPTFALLFLYLVVMFTYPLWEEMLNPPGRTRVLFIVVCLNFISLFSTSSGITSSASLLVPTQPSPSRSTSSTMQIRSTQRLWYLCRISQVAWGLTEFCKGIRAKVLRHQAADDFQYLRVHEGFWTVRYCLHNVKVEQKEGKSLIRLVDCSFAIK